MSTHQSFLFVGGPADGQWIVTHGHDVYNVATLPKLGVFRSDDEQGPEEKFVDTHQYVATPLRIGGEIVLVYVYSRLGAGYSGLGPAMMRLLIENYRPGTLISEEPRRIYAKEEDIKKHFNFLCEGGDESKVKTLLPPVWPPARSKTARTPKDASGHA
jgi:hypothetical protein